MSAAAPTDLHDRYGRPSPRRNRTLLLVIAVLSALGLGFLAWAINYHGRPVVQSELLRYQIDAENLATADIAVLRRADDVAAACRIRALAEDHSVVGETSFSVSDGLAERSVTVEVRTERRATSLELLGCSAPGQPQRR